MAIGDIPVGYVCSALRAIGMRDLGTGGFTGFEKAWNVPYTPYAWYDGDHGAAVTPPALNRLVDQVLGLPPDPPDTPAPELKGLPPGAQAVLSGVLPVRPPTRLPRPRRVPPPAPLVRLRARDDHRTDCDGRHRTDPDPLLAGHRPIARRIAEGVLSNIVQATRQPGRHVEPKASRKPLKA